jgi:hypothetical protein
MMRTNHQESLGLFAAPKSIGSLCKQLEKILAAPITSLVACYPYIAQTELRTILFDENSDLKSLIKDYIKYCDINVSNNVGMTLLHTLIWGYESELAKMIAELPEFTKINYKFCIPSWFGGMIDGTPMYGSALDLAIGQFCLYQDANIALYAELIETMLKNGALLPNPAEEFLNGEFVSLIYPCIIELMLKGDAEFADVFEQSDFNESESSDDESVAKEEAPTGEPRTVRDLQDLFCMLYRYGFSLEDMHAHFNKRLFDSAENADNSAAEFASVHRISVENQRLILDKFMKGLFAAAKDLPRTIVTSTLPPEKLDKGESTLQLPFDRHVKEDIYTHLAAILINQGLLTEQGLFIASNGKAIGSVDQSHLSESAKKLHGLLNDICSLTKDPHFTESNEAYLALLKEIELNLTEHPDNIDSYADLKFLVTPMHTAAGAGLFELVKVLMKFNPDLSLTNCFKQTPSERARVYAKRDDIADFIDAAKPKMQRRF